jgi:hypothetical protein
MPRTGSSHATGAEKLRVFILTRLCPPTAGRPLAGWWRLMRENQFDVDMVFWPKFALNAVCSSLTSLMRLREQKHERDLDSLPTPRPLIVLGHYRSGTTLLQNLLSVDERLAFPTLFQAYNPFTFHVFEPIGKRIAGPLIPRQRMVDRVAMGADLPVEDELALIMLTGCSPYLGFMFPRREERFERYLTFREATEEERERWKQALLWYVKKLSACHGRPIVLKSPPHTARIRLLLQIFPEAKFVHIHRDPYTVFRSTRQLFERMTWMIGMQRPDHERFDGWVLRQYREMHDAFFADRPSIPAGRFHEIRFAELEADPMGEMHRLYDALKLPDFAELRPSLQQYVDSLRGYRKNEYPALDGRQRAAVAEAWGRCFEEWEYPL